MTIEHRAPASAEHKRQRRRRTAREIELPEKLDVFVPESKLYQQLLRLEKRIDAATTRSKLDIQEALANPRQIHKILRLHLSHTLAEDVPGFKFKMQGVLLDPETSNPTKDVYAARFSKFFRKVVVHLDPKLFCDGDSSVEWSRGEDSAELDGIEISRKCSSLQDTSCRVVLYLDDYPKRYKLPPALASALGFQTDTQPRILHALWTYIKRNKLQDSKQPTHVICDSNLLSVFESARVAIPDLAEKVVQCLLPPDPIVFLYRLNMNGDVSRSRQVFDVSVQVPEILDSTLGGLIAIPDAEKTALIALEKKIPELVQRICEHQRRHDLLTAFAESPVDVIRMQMAHQCRDLAILNEKEHADELVRHSAFFTEEWVSDAIDTYLHPPQPQPATSNRNNNAAASSRSNA